MKIKKSLRLIVILVLILLICFTACSSEIDIININNSSFESASTLSENENNTSSLQITTSSQIEVSSKASKPTTSTSSNISSSTSSKTLKILKPKTIEEALLPFYEDYDKIERFPAKKVPNMSKTEFLKFVEKIYEIDLPDFTVFEPNGSVLFRYTLLDKYTYDDLSIGTIIKNLVTYYTKSEIDAVLKQAQENEKLGWGFQGDREDFLNENKQEMEKIVGDLSNKEYYQFDLWSPSRAHTNIQRRRFIFIMKETDNRYIVIFSGETTNYDLYNGTLEVQPNGSAKAIS
ncbi:MAG: hypothetical protein E7551_00855 [Ruminococcaceae bacterium]|nr:hypothetical protein [Oscillospiraceae bacterium]